MRAMRRMHAANSMTAAYLHERFERHVQVLLVELGAEAVGDDGCVLQVVDRAL